MSKKKKILYIITKSNFGGAQRHVYDLVTNLPTNIYDITVACGGHGLLYNKLNGKKIKTLELKELARDVRFFNEFKAQKELEKIIKSTKPDIVHLHSSKAGYLGARAAKKLNVKKILFTAHGWPFNEERNILFKRLIKYLSKKTVDLSTTTIVVSKRDLEEAKKMGIGDKTILIPNGINLSENYYSHEDARKKITNLLPKHVKDNKKLSLVVTIAELTNNKGIKYAIEAMKNVSDCHYCIIGEGEDEKLLKDQVKKFGLNGNVSFLGFIEDAYKYLTAFDIFLITSIKEGLPYTLLEAGFARLNVIATDVGGIPDVIENSVTGLLVPSKNPDAIADAINSILKKNAGYREELHKRINNYYSLEEMVKRVEEQYRL